VLPLVSAKLLHKKSSRSSFGTAPSYPMQVFENQLGKLLQAQECTKKAKPLAGASPRLKSVKNSDTAA
jgi:hypothetical protein